MRTFRVGTFFDEPRPGRKPHVRAYTVRYSPAWVGCIEYEVEAESGQDAKCKAMALRLEYEGVAA